ncbi:MAG: hypothetical protein DRO40_11105 [Thermoprotei archaeon]|nr:MAG: hypothetical protein DRO40_11105 [Thermoprotei archaeon]
MVVTGISMTTLAYVGITMGIGYIIGMAIKKATGFILTVTGLYFLSLIALANFGVVSINWLALSELAKKIVGTSLSPLMTSSVLTLPLLSGIVLGLVFAKSSVKKNKYWVR